LAWLTDFQVQRQAEMLEGHEMNIRLKLMSAIVRTMNCRLAALEALKRDG
jgi:hypothetical protein